MLLLKQIRSSAIFIMNEKWNEIFMHLWDQAEESQRWSKPSLQPKRVFMNEKAWKLIVPKSNKKFIMIKDIVTHLPLEMVFLSYFTFFYFIFLGEFDGP